MAVFKTNLTITSTTTMKPSLWKFSTAFRSSLSSLSLDISSPIYWADRMTDECLNVLEWQNIFTFITPSQTTRTSRTIVSQRLNDKCPEFMWALLVVMMVVVVMVVEVVVVVVVLDKNIWSPCQFKSSWILIKVAVLQAVSPSDVTAPRQS